MNATSWFLLLSMHFAALGPSMAKATNSTTMYTTVVVCPVVECDQENKKCKDPKLDSGGCPKDPCDCGPPPPLITVILSYYVEVLAATGVGLAVILVLLIMCGCCCRMCRDKRKAEKKAASATAAVYSAESHAMKVDMPSSHEMRCPTCLKVVPTSVATVTVNCCSEILHYTIEEVIPPQLPAKGSEYAPLTLLQDESKLVLLLRRDSKSSVKGHSSQISNLSDSLSISANMPRAKQARLAAHNYKMTNIGETTLSDPIAMDRRTFRHCNMKKVYLGTPKVEFQHVLIQAVEGLVYSISSRKGIAKNKAQAFFIALQEEAFRNTDALQKDVCSACEFLWTSGKQLDGMEFCSLINLAFRDDDPLDIVHVCVIARCLNERRVLRTAAHSLQDQMYPSKGECFRGTGWDEEHRAFFKAHLNQKYRVPGFLATSNSKCVAESFLLRVAVGKPRVFWTVKFDPRGETESEFRVKHMSFVSKSLVPGEGEFLFSPYSVFTILKLKWSSNPENPHKITIESAIDNRVESEELPLVPWY